MSSDHNQMTTTTTTTVRFYDSTFYTIALTSVTYLIFQTYSIRPHAHRLILFLSFLCTCLSCETFFHIFQPNSLVNFSNLNITNYFSPTIIHLTLLLSICSFLWNATQCAALASILLPSNSIDKQPIQPPNFVLRRWLRHVCVDHVFALLLVRLGRLTDVVTVTALSNMASTCVITSWCSQIAVFPCILCFLYSLFNDTTNSDKQNSSVILSPNMDEFNSVLHRLKIIKIMGLALFGLKISALSLCETLALALTASICLSCLVVAPPGREMSKYTRIFDIFIGKIPGEDKDESIAIENEKQLIIVRKSIVSNTVHQRPITRSSISHSSSAPTIESKEVSTTTVIDYSTLIDEEVLTMIKSKKLAAHNLEKYFPLIRAVHIRRLLLDEQLKSTKNSLPAIESLPYEHYDYSLVINQCCENVIGYVQIPVGYAGPLRVDNKLYYIPMATTEGALVASTNRGCKAVSMSKYGIETIVFNDGMTRGPVLKFHSIRQAYEAYEWFETNFDEIKQCFDRTSSYARLTSIKRNIAANHLFVRFVATTGDAMGMNMLSKGVEAVLTLVRSKWPETADIISISGNYCIDKKPSALNWIDGRGKSVVAEAFISHEILEQVLKTNANRLVELNHSKNLLGSIMAGSIGGFNAHAANIVTAMFIACGQDPAQVVSSSNCLTWLETTGPEKRDLYISCTMYSLEVGTIGGGTKLSAQQACLKILGIDGSSGSIPGENSCQLARLICSTVLAGELSLMSALATNDLVNSHLRLNRSATAHSQMR
jgi:NADP-dependent 3-hydroxy-3-methylglutaryl-CoA reductase